MSILITVEKSKVGGTWCKQGERERERDLREGEQEPEPRHALLSP